jgi:hypothetical protein
MYERGATIRPLKISNDPISIEARTQRALGVFLE